MPSLGVGEISCFLGKMDKNICKKGIKAFWAKEIAWKSVIPFGELQVFDVVEENAMNVDIAGYESGKR